MASAAVAAVAYARHAVAAAGEPVVVVVVAAVATGAALETVAGQYVEAVGAVDVAGAETSDDGQDWLPVGDCAVFAVGRFAVAMAAADLAAASGALDSAHDGVALVPLAAYDVCVQAGR